MKRLLHIVLVLAAAVACRGPRVIPKDTLTDIFTEMFLADRKVQDLDIPRPQMDSLLLYEAIFEKYGYDTDDYMYSLRHYLRDPERFTKVFEGVVKNLEGEIAVLDKLIALRDRENELANRKFPKVDSILAPFSKEAQYAGQVRLERDTALYAAWYRLVAVQEDTLMVSVDSVEARALRAKIAALKDSLLVEASDKDAKSGKDAKAGREKSKKEKPLALPPGEQVRRRTPKLRQQEIPAEVVVEKPVEEDAE